VHPKNADGRKIRLVVLVEMLKNLKASHFAAIIVSLVVSAILLALIYVQTGVYLLTAAGPPFLVALVLLVAFTLLSSKLFFKFSRKDAAGLAMAYSVIELAILALGFAAAGAINYRLPDNYLVTSIVSIAIGALIYYGALYFAFGKDSSKKGKK
jgi:hypothetical protein